MYKEEYLETLDRLLTSLSYNERREIMYDYEEHFKEGLKEGSTEEEIIAALGAPEKIASGYIGAVIPISTEISNGQEEPINDAPRQSKPQVPRQRYGNSIGEIVALSIVALIFNSIFLGFYLGLWGVLIGFTVAGIALVIGGFTLLISTIIATPIAFISAPAILLQYPVLLVALAVILICIGGLTLIGMYYLIRYTCILSYRYIKWLIRLIRGF